MLCPFRDRPDCWHNKLFTDVGLDPKYADCIGVPENCPQYIKWIKEKERTMARRCINDECPHIGDCSQTNVNGHECTATIGGWGLKCYAYNDEIPIVCVHCGEPAIRIYSVGTGSKTKWAWKCDNCPTSGDTYYAIRESAEAAAKRRPSLPEDLTVNKIKMIINYLKNDNHSEGACALETLLNIIGGEYLEEG
jgi:hypothetical protein